MSNARWLPIFLILILAFIWGSSFILMKEGLKSLTAFQVAALRLFVAGVFFIPVFIVHFRKVDPKDYKILLLSGLTGSGVPAFLFTTAQMHINSSTAGALNALTPIFTWLIGVLFLALPFEKRKAYGVGLGFIGALFIILMKPGSSGIQAETEGLLVVLATFLYGINVNIIKHRLGHYNPWIVAALPIVFMLPLASFVLWSNDFFETSYESAQDLKSVGAIVLLGLVGTAISLVLFNRLIQMTNAVLASSVTYLIPVFALFWGVLDQEQTGMYQFVGMLLILIGIAIIRSADRQKKEYH